MKQVTGKNQLPLVDLNFCWVIALRAEANPVIEAFDMKIVSNKLLFPVYINSENGHCLVISGIGSAKSAAAATYLAFLLTDAASPVSAACSTLSAVDCTSISLTSAGTLYIHVCVALLSSNVFWTPLKKHAASLWNYFTKSCPDPECDKMNKISNFVLS